MPEVPVEKSDWAIRPLEQLTSLIKDGSHGTHQDIVDGVPFLSAKDVRDGALEIPVDCRRISKADYKLIHANYKIEKNDILLTIVGSIGRCYLITGVEPNFSIQRSVGVIRPNGIKSGYLYHYFRSEPFQRNLKDFTNASAQGGVYLGSLAKCTVEFPSSKSEQSKITEVLSTVDRAIEQTEALIAKQQRIKTGLMQDLLIRGIDEHGDLRSEETHEFKDSPLGRIPVEWEVKPAMELCDAVIDCKNRTPPSAKEGHPVIRTPNIRNGEFVFNDLAYTDPFFYQIWVARGKPKAGDVVITREAPFGEACLIPASLEAPCLGQRIMMYQPDVSKLLPAFMVFAIYSEYLQKKMLELAGGSTVGHIRVGDIRELPISHPKSVEEQRTIAAILSAEAAMIRKHETQRLKMKAFKTALMQDLLTGKKRVVELLNSKEEEGVT